MGNCQQAGEAATVIIQHPANDHHGKNNERLYYYMHPTTAEEVMKSNPGHHVALVTTLRIAQENHLQLKLLKPKDTLTIGHVYRLVTSREVSDALEARRLQKINRGGHAAGQVGSGKRIIKQVKRERRKNTANPGTEMARQWQPKLQSISEGGS